MAALNSNPSSPPQDDGVSLLAFKSEADPSNKLGYSVDKSSAVCKWQGVQCQIDGKVGRLVLENLNLAGVFAANTLSRLDQLRVLSLRNNSLTGPIPDLAGLVNLKALFLDHNYFSGGIPSSISTLHRLRTLDLSYNKLSGVIPVELSDLDRLNYLRLDSNRFSGSIPPLNQSSLQIFNVSINFLTGPVPVTPTLSRFGPALFSINPRLCGKIVRTECGSGGPFFGKNSTTNQPSSSPPVVASGQSAQVQPEIGGFTNSNSTKQKRLGLIVGFSAGLFLLVTSVLCIIMLIKTSEKKKRKSTVTKREMMEMAEAADAAAEVMRMEDANELEKKVRKLHQGIALKKSGNLVFYTGESQLYTVEQLMRASAELLGSGSVGTTYKALLDNGVILCVKRLDASRLAGTTNEAFQRHMEVVGTLRHPNVVALRAYFQAKEEKLLVYDYQPNGSLFSLVHGSKSTMAKPLHWTSCLKIAEDVAQGVSYLHQACSLVHGNLKSSNVLLGSDFEACLSDYCLSSLFHHLPDDGDGDPYKAPETGTDDEPTTKSDVYSFGVLLFELLTGKSASEQPDLLPDDVVKWVRSSRDSNGGGGMAEKPLEMITEVAIACTVRSPELRPTMWQVIKMLQEIKEAAIMEDCGIVTS
ncbi:Leucine-rich repeat-containing protein [Cynara cardunculus var. scolymus]|uniref:Leucine-rich repeat-containing protein n=2 Tax=Cynara cardunculus var. scolymus TaxID=59895 RepID=A0A124SDX1_CYNCS|nr:Leucine-rich repeat-containing protein [Cynara cardunculus var. scolymus]